MALLHYQNLVDHRPDVLMTKAFYGLKDHNDYLDRIKKYTESDDAVSRLAVRKGYEPNPYNKEKKYKKKQAEGSVWVELTEPEDLKEVSDKVFEAFLDDEVKSVYEMGSDTSEDLGSSEYKRRGKKFIKSREIRVLARDSKTEQLLLERMPAGDILLRPNTYTVQKQLEAARRLQNSPSQAHRPLLRLFEDRNHARWQPMPPDEFNFTELDWKVLTDASRPGTTEQRRFVVTALNTPDFALLEGPPGSGKTTAICELIIHLILQGKRVLLCASTHVAVDNVIERLMNENNQHRHLVIPVRIGKDDCVSDRVLPWTLGRFVKTESNRIKDYLNQQASPTGSQSLLKRNLQNDPSLIERMVLDSANLVCGTTIGLLQHPDIRGDKGIGSPQFDVMIIDEASKTTFQEFLVPALHAKRWILVGDPRQLSPYVDDQELALNIAPCLPKSAIRNACVDVFLAKQRSEKKRRVSVVEVTEDRNFNTAAVYEQQARRHGVLLKRAQPDHSLGYASIVIGNRQELQLSEDYVPLDATNFRLSNDKSILPMAERRATAYASRRNLRLDVNPSWENEIAWRQARLYEQRLAPKKANGESKKNTMERLKLDLADLMPVEVAGINVGKLEEDIDSVRRVALPSVLDCLCLGFERRSRDRNGSALTDGLPDNVIDNRRVLLSFQHRMHPEIAEFSHRQIYHEEALKSPDNMAAKRDWDYRKYSSRSAWVDVKGKPGKKNSNKTEATEVMKRLQHFDRWASSHLNDGKPWEVAVLCFYRGQEYELQQRLKDWTRSKSKRHFHRADKNSPYLSIHLCTVDRFQGHEADLVFLSFSNDHVTSFLESPNRLNVALTRARYQLVIVGNRQKFKESKSLVGKLASLSKWDVNLENK